MAFERSIVGISAESIQVKVFLLLDEEELLLLKPELWLPGLKS
ncbi:hypothetical protein AT236_00247 [Lactobacillus delbrueckii subsp. bulgaricus]|nr:hypothetical protein AT236_00247 [Lactobacillus delbrueckii subsp. bulgaricus]EHE90150.1 hypothetical protein LDBUL1632_00687 [Lactobacillus delbrueckii subsp. bulgaricus CNCM I-1632]EHE91497.1 hypothetical protein LDBUL1519_00078 [Lactobacillus delbrueckii subsp. bulgaricus CNCM I-1519]OAL42249.1 hypothetical protein A0O29_0262 [Lactobacillus delbrueckii subsp. bulgaricus]